MASKVDSVADLPLDVFIKPHWEEQLFLERLRVAICAKLYSDTDLQKCSLDVEVFGKTVVLFGRVPHRRIREQAEKIVRSIISEFVLFSEIVVEIGAYTANAD